MEKRQVTVTVDNIVFDKIMVDVKNIELPPSFGGIKNKIMIGKKNRVTITNSIAITKYSKSQITTY